MIPGQPTQKVHEIQPKSIDRCGGTCLFTQRSTNRIAVLACPRIKQDPIAKVANTKGAARVDQVISGRAPA
jgi:hypothetical protein